MRKQENKVAERHPEPAPLDKDDIEDIALFGEVGWGEIGWVRLREGAVWGTARCRIEEGEERAGEESKWVDCKQYRLERSRQ